MSLIKALTICICGIAALVLAINAYVYLATTARIYQSADASPTVEAVIIPGAAILRSGKMSPIFQDRADMAIQLYAAGKAHKILVSGDNSTLSHNEVNPVRTYLLQNGIPDEDIFLDHAGFDTYSTMYRARYVFGVDSAVVATQSFHLPRSVFLAKELGIDAYGVNADAGRSNIKNYFREALASVKAVINLFSHREPKYLGDPIPIEGDGRNYP